MDKALDKKIRRAGLAAALVLAFSATWAVLDRTEHRPGWLAVEAPAAAVVGRPLEIRVTLKRSIGTTKIVCSLHRAGADRKIRGYLASSGPAREAVGGGTYSFVFEVPEREDMAFAAAIVYLSPTGDWQDGTLAVSTKLMPVKRDGAAAEIKGLGRTQVYRFMTAAESAAAKAAERSPGRGPSPWAHPVISLLLLASAFLCVVKSGRGRMEGQPGAARDRKIWLAFAAVLAFCALLELSGLAGHLSTWGRRLAAAANLYEFRRPYQKAVMAVIAAGALGLFFLFIRAMKRPGAPHHLWWAGMGLAGYLSVSFVSVLSFHAVDVVRGMTWHGISPVDAARGAGTVVALVATAVALRSKKAS